METESGGLIKVGKKIEVNNALMNENLRHHCLITL